MSEASRVEEIFLAALEKEPGERRTAYLAEACGADLDLFCPICGRVIIVGGAVIAAMGGGR